MMQVHTGRRAKLAHIQMKGSRDYMNPRHLSPSNQRQSRGTCCLIMIDGKVDRMQMATTCPSYNNMYSQRPLQQCHNNAVTMAKRFNSNTTDITII